MPTYIAERYAGILTIEDVGQLFNALTSKLHGNRSEAARQCGLTGKATYDWEKARYVKLTTKRKVLDACLRIDFLDTVEYLLERSSERTVDVLRTVLSSIYNEAIETNSKEQIVILLDKFNALRTQHRGLINDRIMDEVADMLWTLRQKAQELQVPVPPKSIEDISAKELLEVLPLISDMYLKNPRGAPAIAKTLNLPPQSIEMLLPTFEKLHPTVETVTEAEAITPEGSRMGAIIGIKGLDWAQLIDLHMKGTFVEIPWVQEPATSSEEYGMKWKVQPAGSPSHLQRVMDKSLVVK